MGVAPLPDGAETWLNWVVRESRKGARSAGAGDGLRRECERRYALLPAERGAGVASDALRALTRWLHDRFGVTTLTAEIDDANAPSTSASRSRGGSSAPPAGRARSGVEDPG